MLNARSLFYKIDELRVFATLKKPNVICVTETWLCDDIFSELLHIPGYQLCRQDRNDRRGGGTAVFLEETITFSIVHKASVLGSEILMIDLMSFQLFLVCIYIPPNVSSSCLKEIHDRLEQDVDRFLTSKPNYNAMIAGDMNKFDTGALCEDLSLFDLVNQPTRQESILDHIVVSNELSPSYSSENVVYDPPLGNGDHRIITITPSQQIPDTNNALSWHKVFDLRQSNMQRLYCAAGRLDWQELIKLEDLDMRCSVFQDTLKDVFAQCIPVRDVCTTRTDKDWITPRVKSVINDRWNAYRAKNWKLFRHLKEKAKREIIKAKKDWSAKLKSSSGSIWKFVKKESTKRNPSGLEALMTDDVSFPIFLNQVTARIAQDFSSDMLQNEPQLVESNSKDWQIEVTEAQVHNLLRKLPAQKSPGFDEIPAKVYKFLADIIALPLTLIFNESLKKRIFPAVWKKGVMIAIPKTNPPSIDKLRMITLLPAPAKILERIAMNSVMRHFESSFGSSQHGFRRRHSTTTAVIDLTDRITRLIDDRTIYGGALLSFDLSRAFDTIEHPLLLRSLMQNGFPNGFVRWVSSYLLSRAAHLRLKGSLSLPFAIGKGVPQGSVLGPALFCSFMGNLTPLNVENSIMKYADDVHIVIPLQTNDEMEAHHKVEEEVSHMRNWTQDMGLTLNLSKSEMMLVGRRDMRKLLPSPPLPIVKEMRVLGVMLSEKLTWNAHINYIAARANRRFFLLRRLKPTLNAEDLHNVYCAMIRSLLEYACPVFAGIGKTLESKLQKLDNRAHRLIYNQKNSYTGLQTCPCQYNSLRHRRNEQSLRLLRVIAEAPDHLLKPKLPRMGRKRFILEFSRTTQRQASFIPFCCQMWNSSV